MLKLTDEWQSRAEGVLAHDDEEQGMRDQSCSLHLQSSGTGRPFTDPDAGSRAAVMGALSGLRPAARRWSTDWAAAEDLMQDTMERALGSLDRFKDGTNVNAWLRTIMYRLAVDESRRNQRDRSLRVEYAQQVAVDSTSDEEDERSSLPAYGLRDIRRVARALEEPFKTTFLLWATESLSYQEISRRTGAPIGTVATRLLRARRALRELLERSHAGGRTRASRIPKIGGFAEKVTGLDGSFVTDAPRTCTEP